MNVSKRKWLPREMASLLFSMQLLGLYHSPENFRYIQPESNQSLTKKYGLLIQQNVWHLFCIGLMLFNLGRSIVSFWWTELDIAVYAYIIYAVWTAQCFLNSASLYISVICKERIGGFFKFWHTYCNGCCFASGTPLIDRMWLRKTSLYATILTWVLIVGNMVGVLYQNTGPHIKPEHRQITTPWATLPALVIAIVTMIFASGAWLFPITFFSVVCKLLAKQFQVLSDSLAQADTPVDKIDFVRKQHTYLCQAVQKADVIFGPILAITYVTNVPLAIFLFYQILFAGFDTIELMLNSFWALVSCIQVAIVSFDAAVVNDKAHSLKEQVYALEIKNGDFRSLQIQSLLLSRLTGPPVGFTALGFVVVTKELVLGVFGAILTYFTILIQFRTPSTAEEQAGMTTSAMY